MSYQQYRPNSFSVLPPVVKNLLILNGLFFLASMVLESQYKIDLSDILGLHFPLSERFRSYQLVSYMFMHATFSHLFFNMFALWMFGNVLENFWGSKRFLTYYMITGIGAAVVQLVVTYFRLESLYSQVSPEDLTLVLSKGQEVYAEGKNFIDGTMGEINILINNSTIGASGAVFGILLAFGMLFPNTLLYIYFAIPIKAKWFVVLYGAAELFFGIANNPNDNVAHFAHLGGMLFGFILIMFWKKNKKTIF